MYARVTPIWAKFTVIQSGYGTFFASTIGTARSFQSYWGGQIKPVGEQPAAD